MLILHVSDTHLGAARPRKHGRLKERELDFYEVFDEVVDIAVREGVDAVVHCGDFFDDPKPNPQTYYYAFKSLRKLRDAGARFLVIAGQHDQPKASALPPLRILDEVGLATTMAVSDVSVGVVKLRSGELGVAAIPYTHPQLACEMIRGLRKPDARKRVLMAHLLLKELNLPAAHLSLSELRASEFSYVALGDYHMRYATSYSGVPVVYPGSTEALNVLEASDERYVVLADLSGDEARVSWVKLGRFRRWVVASEIKNYSQLMRALSTKLAATHEKPPILYVKLGSRDLPPSDSKLIHDYLSSLERDGKVLFYRVEVPGTVAGEEEEGAADGVDDRIPTLEAVVYEVVGDRELAEFLIWVIRGCDEAEFVSSMINRLVSDEGLLGRLEKLVKKG